jgi:hypothetical protein
MPNTRPTPVFIKECPKIRLENGIVFVTFPDRESCCTPHVWAQILEVGSRELAKWHKEMRVPTSITKTDTG